ncbi:hypothetical protein GALL_525440 [mine drainage metagenome]|uniref:Uncharacterized protein n=1 Tax=mine drainage metagenome TaxID=410659 RepID=A0A1J5PQN1_9ZZZZ
MPKAQASSAPTLPLTKPHAATSMIAISSSLTARISRALSSLSASWPLVAENSTKGRMYKPAIRLTSRPGEIPPATR